MARRSDRSKKRDVVESKTPRDVVPTPGPANGRGPQILLSVQKTPAPSDEPLIEALVRLAVAHVRARGRLDKERSQ
jgi:hypothetical protein